MKSISSLSLFTPDSCLSSKPKFLPCLLQLIDEAQALVLLVLLLLYSFLFSNSCSFSSPPTTMAFSSCFTQAQLPFKIGCSGSGSRISCSMGLNQRSIFTLESVKTELVDGRAGVTGAKVTGDWSFFGKATVVKHPNLGRAADCGKISRFYASCLSSSQLASSVFTMGTAAVLPFYTLMVAAPKAKLTKKLMGSSIPFTVLGLLYLYLLYLSWTPDTIQLMFASKYWLPELPGMVKLFSSEMTLASAWIHLLVIDLFAARQVFHDGLQDNIETRHSVSLCLLFCPVGILTHFVTKALTENLRKGIH